MKQPALKTATVLFWPAFASKYSCGPRRKVIITQLRMRLDVLLVKFFFLTEAHEAITSVYEQAVLKK